MKKDNYSIIYIAIIVFVLIFGCNYIYIAELPEIIKYSGDFKGDLDKTGQLGDSAGLINALFSGLAFGGVILTIIWQINNDRRNRIADQKTQFENTFFNMSQTFEDIIEGLTLEKEDNDADHVDSLLVNLYVTESGDGKLSQNSENIKGRIIFRHLFMERKVEGKTLRDSIKDNGISAFEKIMDGLLDHYFRYFYRILKFIDGSDLITTEEKYHYTSILRAQLSEYELVMIYYNSLSEFGNEKLKPLVEKYSMMKNLRKDDLAISLEEEVEKLPRHFSDSAFKHKVSFEGNWISILIRSIFASIVIVLFLELTKTYLNDFIFRDILSLELFRNSSGTFVALLVASLLLYGIQLFFENKRVEIIKRSYTRKWDEARYILSRYYDAGNLTVLIPIIVSLVYLCGSHQWYGYGFLLYVHIIILWLMVKPLMAVIFTGVKMYEVK